MRLHPRLPDLAALVSAIALAVSLAVPAYADGPAAAMPPLAALPLTNLSGATDAAGLYDVLLLAELSRTGPVVEAGVIEAAMDSLRIRPTAALTAADMRALGGALGVRYLVVGTVLEHGTMRTPDGNFPCSGIALKVLDAESTRVVWSRSRFACGDDRETVFGWGRDFDPHSVAVRVTEQLCRELRRAFRPGAVPLTKGASS